MNSSLPLGNRVIYVLGYNVYMYYNMLSLLIFLSQYQTRSSIREMDSYSQAGKQAEEVMKSVRTVVAFAGESKESERYRFLLLNVNIDQ